MNGFNFEWDDSKAKSNFKKHEVSFYEAKSVFWDVYAKLIPDPDSSVGEERFILLGQSDGAGVLIVCHCYRESDDVVRIISARRASKNERKHYERSTYA